MSDILIGVEDRITFIAHKISVLVALTCHLGKQKKKYYTLYLYQCGRLNNFPLPPKKMLSR